MKALGISRGALDRVSAVVRGKERTVKIRAQLPKYSNDDSQYNICVNFWREFFGDQAQTSGDGHRYYPVNLSSPYIYHDLFWPYWKEFVKHWVEDCSDPDQGQLPLGQIQKLFAR